MNQPSSVKPENVAITIPRRLDAEDAQLALQKLQTILKRHEVIEELAHRQYEDQERSNLLEGLLHRQHENEIKAIVNGLHPSDIAFILESLLGKGSKGALPLGLRPHPGILKDRK